MEDPIKLGKKLMVSYSILQGVNVMGYCTVCSFATVFLLSRGFTNSQVGLTVTLASGFSLLFQPVMAAFADKTKRFSLRSIIAAIMFVSMITSFLLVVAPSIAIPTVILTAVLYILLMCFFSTQASLVTSLAMEHINSGVPVNYSLARGIGSLAFAVLSTSMGYLVDRFGGAVVMLINVGLGFLGILLVSTFRKAKKPAATREEGEAKAAGLVEFALKNKRFMAVIGAVSLIFFSHVLINIFSIQIIKNVGGNNADLGIALAIAAFVELPGMALFPRIYRKIQNAGLMMKLAAAFFVIKAILTLLATSVFGFIVAQCFQFFAYAMFIPASVYYVNQVVSEVDKNKGQVLMNMTNGISGMISSLIGGLILDSSGGVGFMLVLGIIVSFAGLVMLVVFDKSKKEKLNPGRIAG